MTEQKEATSKEREQAAVRRAGWIVQFVDLPSWHDPLLSDRQKQLGRMSFFGNGGILYRDPTGLGILIDTIGVNRRKSALGGRVGLPKSSWGKRFSRRAAVTNTNEDPKRADDSEGTDYRRQHRPTRGL